MPDAIDHPVFGRLIPDQWNEDLLCFREFPSLRKLCSNDPQELMRDVQPAHRKPIENWKDQPPQLAKICRNFEVIAVLQAMGVYEVTVVMGERAEPSAEQAAAYRYFGEHEEAICENICDALFRYYSLAREQEPDWFDDGDGPHVTTPEELFPLVRFDGFSVRRAHCGGKSLLSLGWDPDWDPEHGLRMGVWRDQVFSVGEEDILDTLDDPEYGLWKPEAMTDAEREVLQQLQAAIVFEDDG